jgi:hypothetical protein
MNKKDNIKIIDINEKKITKSIFSKYLKFNGLLIIRNLFQQDDIVDELKKFNKKKRILKEISGPYFYKKKNFSRFDKKLVKNKYIVHGRHQYLHTLFTWNRENTFRKVFKKLISLRNNIYGITSKNDVFNYKGSKYINVPKILHYPNNGFLGKHVDNSPVQDRNFIIIASKKGLNFSRGGLSYEINNKYIEIEKYVKIGDVVCNDYKVKHGVKKITSSKNQSGRFSVVLSMHKV